MLMSCYRVERSFDQLVDEMITSDLAIRVGVEKAELLIFPSTVLPTQYRSKLHYITYMTNFNGDNRLKLFETLTMIDDNIVNKQLYSSLQLKQ